MIEFLSTIDDSTLIEVFGEIDQREYMRYSRISQTIESGSSASLEQVIHSPPNGPTEVKTAVETGSFTEGFGSPDSTNARIDESLARSILGNDPAYLNPRFTDDFAYRQLSDSTIWGCPSQVYSINAREGINQRIRKAVYFVCEDMLIAVSFESAHETILLSENSESYLSGRLVGDDLIPHHLHFSVNLKLPFTPMRKMERTEIIFRNL